MNDMLHPAPPPPRQPLLFQWLRWKLLGNTLRVTLERSPGRLLTIFLCSLLIWGGIFYVSWGGFAYLSSDTVRLPLDGLIIGLLFDLLFVALTVLPVFSSSIILYS